MAFNPTIAERKMIEDAIERRHPGWKNTINSPEFVQWFGRQPCDVRDKLASSWEIQTVSDLLADFKRYMDRTRGVSSPRPVRDVTDWVDWNTDSVGVRPPRNRRRAALLLLRRRG
jgi:hypothetical protein